MGRSPCCDDTGLKKGPWTSEEDETLISYIQKHGHGSWRALPKHAGLNRCGKSCRLRWTNYLRPDIKRGKFTAEEEQTILNLHSMFGNKWSTIATHLPGRTDNEIKNFWNTHLKKKLIQMGFDPMTHRPRTDIFASLPHLIALANLKEIMEQNSWENQAVRLQNEAAEMAKLQYLKYLLQPNLSSMMLANNFSLSTNMESCNLLTSLSSVKDNTPFLLDSWTVPSISLNMTDHLPDLDEPCTQSNHRDHAAQASDITVPHSQVQASAPPATGTPPVSGTNACSTSSSFEGGPSSSSIWPELLLDDPLFHEIA